MILEAKQISKSFADKKVLEDVSFSIGQGQIIGLVGRNGSGKTTILKILSRIFEEDEGKVLLDNKLIDKFPKLKVHVAYLPDNFSFFDYENISGAIEYYEIIYPDFNRSFVEKELRKIGIRAKDSIRGLSKGNKSLVGLILILATNAEILLIDEILDGMDVLNKEKIMTYLLDASADGRSILVSSHELEELENIADKVLYLSLDGVLTELARDNMEIVKIQIVSRDVLPEKIVSKVIIKQKIGRVYTVLARGNRSQWDLVLSDESVTQYDYLKIRIEDLFYYERGGSQ